MAIFARAQIVPRKSSLASLFVLTNSDARAFFENEVFGDVPIHKVNATFSIPAYSVNTPLTQNLVAYYKLDETSGDALPTVGSVTLTNTGSTPYATGKINNGADFGAYNTTKYLYANNNLGITGGVCSISIWYKAIALTAGQSDRIVAQGDAGTIVNNTIDYTNVGGITYLNFNRQKQNVQNEQVTYIPSFTTDTWHHLVYTYDNINVRAYVDGALIGSIVASGTGGTGGGSQIAINDLFAYSVQNPSGGGIKDELGIWNKALSSGDILELYNSGNGLSHPFTSATNITVTPSIVTATFSVPAYTITTTQDITITPSVQAGTFSIPSYTISSSLTIEPTTLNSTFSIPSATISVTENITLSPSLINSTFSIPSYTVISSTTFSTSTLNTIFSIPSYTISTTANVTVTPTPLNATFSIPVYSAVVVQDITVSPALVNATFSIPSHIITTTSILTGLQLAYNLNGNSNDSVGSSNGADTSSVIKNTSFALPTTEITIAIWVKTSDTSTAKEVFLLGADGILDANSARHSEFRLEIASGGSRQAGWIPFIAGTPVVLATTGQNYADGAWHLLIARAKSGSQILKIDDVDRASATASGTMTARTGFAIGDISENPSLHWFVPATKDALYIWDRFLTDAECTTLWNGGTGIEYNSTANVTVTPSIVNATFSIPVYTASASIEVTPNVQSATFSIPSYDIVTSTTQSPSILTATFSIPIYTVTATQDITVSPSILTATFSIPAYSISISVINSPALVNATFSIPAYSIISDGNTSITPSLQLGTFSIPVYTISTTSFVTVTPNILNATFSIPSYTNSISSTISANSLSATFTILYPVVTVTQDITITPTPLNATFSIPIYTSTATEDVVFVPTTMALTFSTYSYTIITVENIVIFVDLLSAIFTIPLYLARGDFWQDSLDTPNQNWGNKFSVPNQSWIDSLSVPNQNWQDSLTIPTKEWDNSLPTPDDIWYNKY
jgi:hypothetical protein